MTTLALSVESRTLRYVHFLPESIQNSDMDYGARFHPHDPSEMYVCGGSEAGCPATGLGGSWEGEIRTCDDFCKHHEGHCVRAQEMDISQMEWPSRKQLYLACAAKTLWPLREFPCDEEVIEDHLRMPFTSCFACNN